QPGSRFLYAVQDIRELNGHPGGGASAFVAEPATGTLIRLNVQPVHGLLPCYVTFDPTGRWLLAANYGAGNVVVLPILEDGSLGPVSDIVQHHGASVDPQRQEGPHTHSIVLDPTGRCV